MTKRLLGYPLMALALTACVTINIYFPAAAAEEAARTIVRDVLKSDPAIPPAPDQVKGDKQSQTVPQNPLLVLIGGLLERMIPAAHAGQADIDINSSAIRAIRASMEARQSAIAPFYRSGAAGFDNKGMVSVRDLAAVSLKDRNTLKRLVVEENADRSKLYSEIARANGHPEWEGDVRETFAKVWRQEAPAGYWYQNAAGNWKQR